MTVHRTPPEAKFFLGGQVGHGVLLPPPSEHLTNGGQKGSRLLLMFTIFYVKFYICEAPTV